MTFRFGLLDKHNELLKLKEFHNMLFKTTDVTHEWLTWYLQNVNIEQLPCETRVYTLYDDAKLIGTWCVEPKTLIKNYHGFSSAWNDNFAKVGRCFSVGIHSDYRRKNLFVELSKFAIEQERNVHKQYDYILGFPQTGRPVIEAHMKSGWDHVQTIDIWSHWKFKQNTMSLYKSNVEIIWDFEFQSKDYKGSFLETSCYKNNRWLNHPDYHYICLNYKNAYVVLKMYAGTCHILDINGSSEEAKHLLETTKTLANRHKCQEITMWCAYNDPHLNDVMSAEFSYGASTGTSVELLAIRINATNKLSLTQTHFSNGVEEQF